MHRIELPQYNVARGGAAPTSIKPPFDFDGSVVRLFPLRARVDHLQSFIDSYLNIAPPEVAYFRVFTPYVMLAFIYYGKMSLDAANFGWISQNEVLFSVPLLWYRRSGKRWQFVDYASTTPFIYVDDDFSLANGREAYGWPKDRIFPEKVDSTWATNPESDRILAQFSIKTFSELYSGERAESRTMMTIRQHREPLLFRYPFDPRAAWLPWVGLPRAIKGAADFGRDLFEIMRAFGLSRRQGGMRADVAARSARSLLQAVDPLSKGLWTNNFNLKQFRDAEFPTMAAYQALTNSPMVWKRITRAGFIGEQALLQGDSTGGVSIDMYDCPNAPIVSSLGLEIAEDHSIRGGTKRILRPTFPMWMQVDMRYQRGQTLAWRANDARTLDNPDDAGNTKLPRKVRWNDSQGRVIPTSTPPTHCDYNTARGAADTQMTGPYTIENASLRILPLMADEMKLRQFLAQYLGPMLEKENIEAVPWGNYVYLVVNICGDISSKTNDIGIWAERAVYFYVPSLLFDKGKTGQDRRFLRAALVPVYGYESGAMATQTGVEVEGMPVAIATIESGTDRWLDSRGLDASAKHTLLSLSTPILPAAGTGQRVKPRLLFEVCEGDPVPATDEAAWYRIARSFGESLKKDLKQKILMAKDKGRVDSIYRGRSAMFHVLMGKRTLAMLTLKQIRDAQCPDRACYQSLVESEIRFTHVQEMREISKGLFVRICQYPSQPIVDKLGLVTIATESSGGVLSHLLQPVRPFWAQCSIDWSLGKNISVRVGEEHQKLPLNETLDPADDLAFVHDVHPTALLECMLDVGVELSRKVERIKKYLAIDDSNAKSPMHSIVNELKDFVNFMTRAKLRSRDPADETMASHPYVYIVKLARARIRSVEFQLRAMNCNDQANQFLDSIQNELDKLKLPPEVQHAMKEELHVATNDPWRHALAADKEAAEVRDLLFSVLANYSDKPYHVIRRACIANEKVRNHLFPLQHSFDSDWYDGHGELDELQGTSPPAAESTKTTGATEE